MIYAIIKGNVIIGHLIARDLTDARKLCLKYYGDECIVELDE